MEITLQTCAFYPIVFNCVSVCAYAQVCTGVQVLRPEEGIRSPEPEVTGSYEPVNVGAGTQGQVLWKKSECSRSLCHLSSPRTGPLTAVPLQIEQAF